MDRKTKEKIRAFRYGMWYLISGFWFAVNIYAFPDNGMLFYWMFVTLILIMLAGHAWLVYRKVSKPQPGTWIAGMALAMILLGVFWFPFAEGQAFATALALMGALIWIEKEDLLLLGKLLKEKWG